MESIRSDLGSSQVNAVWPGLPQLHNFSPERGIPRSFEVGWTQEPLNYVCNGWSDKLIIICCLVNISQGNSYLIVSVGLPLDIRQIHSFNSLI